MGKSKPKQKPERNGSHSDGEQAEARSAYFLSLSLENVRCFGPQQTLDLTRGESKPAQWTIILGLNGTGKTTLLQSLAGFERSDVVAPPMSDGKPVYRFFNFKRYANLQLLRAEDGHARFRASVASGSLLELVQ